MYLKADGNFNMKPNVEIARAINTRMIFVDVLNFMGRACKGKIHDSVIK